MKITTIGCGGAFTEELFHNCFMLSENGENLFIDFGQQILPFAFKAAGLTVKDVHKVFITHTHDDHCLSLGTLGLKKYDWKNKPRKWLDSPIDYAPELIVHENILKEIEDVTRGNFRTIEGFISSLETFFKVKTLKDNESFDFQGWTCTPVQQIHVMAAMSMMHSYGLFVEKGEKSFFITSDTQYFQPRQVYYFYNKANFILTDCETTGTNFKFQEGTPYYTKDGVDYPWPIDDIDGMKALDLLASGVEKKIWGTLKFMSGVHATYPEWAGYVSANATILSSSIKKKLWFTHYGDHVVHNKDGFGNPVNWDEQAKKDGFAGFVKLGQVFEV